MSLTVLHGDDDYSIGRAVKELVRRSGFEELDIVRTDARSAGSSSILATVGTPGLFTGRRLVLLYGLGGVKESRATKAKKPSDEALSLAEIVTVTPPMTTVVVVLDAAKADSRLLKEAIQMARSKTAEVQAYPAPKQRDMSRWIAQRAKDQGLRIEPQALHKLAARVGEQPRLAATELDKLCTAAGPNQIITVRLVEEFVAQSAEESIFPLVDAIAAGRLEPALGLSAKQLVLLGGNETELCLRLIRLIARQFRILLQIRLLLSAGATRGEILARLRIPDYFADRYFGQAKRLSELQLRSALERLAAAEQGIKNGEAGDAVLQLLLADITRSDQLPFAA